jgi:SAM-dependent methyltransferase
MSAPGPFRFTTIAHRDRTLLGPVSEDSLDKLLARIPIDPEPVRVLDVGCGKGEILARALERLGGTGVGIEPNPAFAEVARARAAQQLAPGVVRIIETKLADAGPTDFPDHVFTLGICTGALHAFGDWQAALEGMARRVRPDGWALMGPGYWKNPPDPGYLAAFDGREDELHSLLETLAQARASGWQVEACHESTVTEWDAYEHAYAARMREWCDQNAGDEDAKSFRERIDTWSNAYTKWGRDTMGYALMLLRRG